MDIISKELVALLHAFGVAVDAIGKYLFGLSGSALAVLSETLTMLIDQYKIWNTPLVKLAYAI